MRSSHRARSCSRPAAATMTIPIRHGKCAVIRFQLFDNPAWNGRSAEGSMGSEVVLLLGMTGHARGQAIGATSPLAARIGEGPESTQSRPLAAVVANFGANPSLPVGRHRCF